MNLNFRIISKLSFLFVIIGYIIPMFSIRIIFSQIEMNGFQYAAASFELDAAIYGILMYSFLVFVICGLIIGILLLAKKSVPIFFDWFIILVCMAGILFFSIEAKDGATIKSGVYLIGLGLTFSLITQIISNLKKEHLSVSEKEKIKNNNSITNNKKSDGNRTIESYKEVIINNNIDTSGKTKIILERSGNSIYSAASFEIYIDDKQKFSINNNEKKEYIVNNGNHLIYTWIDHYTKSEKINFIANNEDILLKLTVLGVGKIKLERIN